ncbi:homocysteine S-methyltransferase family protein [Nioella sp. MMSF_3534]|uniref:homocysteine S-methyltransferase family protein n=1 Tax=Nioella sp. MMSF_3534 TaxID=3046720 RepID=UPI00273FF98E|nr:homocysteine S-methyltransferase family protein [Nioella sp. MMSF_3534]
MSTSRHSTPEGPILHWVGLETDLIFSRGIDLPGFASYPLLDDPETHEMLRGDYQALADFAREEGVCIMLDALTWVASRDRGRELGYSPERLAESNRKAVRLITEVRDANPDANLILSGQMGPRGDGYEVGDQMTVAEAETFHGEQMGVLSEAGVELVNAFTMTYAAEAAGIARAARARGIPVVIAFTVETDGRLPDGTNLADAIEQVDATSESYPSYFLVNCAHPEHLAPALDGDVRLNRLAGLVSNASRCSHEELDNAEELDAGDPEELGQQIGDLARANPNFRVFGGCCGTDFRHLRAMARNLKE